MTLRPCLDCGRPTASTHCPEHRGYDSAWERLSQRARKLQPWCSDCGATEGLTCDHSPEAWARRAAGKPIRLRDVDVVCGPCNTARGQARPEPLQRNSIRRSGRGGMPRPKAQAGPPKSKFELHTARCGMNLRSVALQRYVLQVPLHRFSGLFLQPHQQLARQVEEAEQQLHLSVSSVLVGTFLEVFLEPFSRFGGVVGVSRCPLGHHIDSAAHEVALVHSGSLP